MWKQSAELERYESLTNSTNDLNFLGKHSLSFKRNRAFFHDVIEALLVFQMKEPAAILVYQTSPWIKVKLALKR